MVLVDTSIWIDHLHRTDAVLADLLGHATAVVHPLVLGEIACGSLARRPEVLGLLRRLPQAPEATHAEALELIERRRLYGRGLGIVDAHLLASCLVGGLDLWSRDRALGAAAAELGVRYEA